MILSIILMYSGIELMDSAKYYVERGEYKTAVKFLKKYVNDGGKDDPQAYKFLIETYGALKKPEKALKWAEKAVKLFPDNPLFINYRAILLDNLGMLDSALTYYRYLFENYPDSISYRVNYGNALYRLGKYEDARIILEKADSLLEAKSSEPGLTFNDINLLYKTNIVLSYIYHKQGRNDRAVKTALKAMQYSMDRKSFYDYILALLFNVKEFDKLENIMRRAVRLYPDEAKYFRYLGLAQYMKAMGMEDEKKDSTLLESIRNLSTSLSLEVNPLTTYYLAKAYQILKRRIPVYRFSNICYYLDSDCRLLQIYELLEEGNFDEAMQIALTIPIKNGTTARLLAYAFEREGKIGLAEKYLKMAVNLEPDNIERYRALIQFLARYGKLKEYYQFLKRYVSLGAEDPYAYYDLANYYSNSGELDSARAYYEKAARLLEQSLDTTANPEQYRLLSYVYNNWGYMLVDKGVNVKKGFELLKKAIQLNPTDPSILDSMGWALYKMGNRKEALPYIEKAYELAPDDDTIKEHYMEINRAEDSGS